MLFNRLFREEVLFSIVLFGEGVLWQFGDELSPRLSKLGTRAAQIKETPVAWGAWDEATTSNKQNFLDTPIGFARANSISDIPCGPGLAFDQEIFKTPTFLTNPDSDGGGATLDGWVLTGIAFTFLAPGLLDNLALRFLIAACEASELGRGRGVYDTPSIQEFNSSDRHLGHSL
jgi:hypothetical protein